MRDRRESQREQLDKLIRQVEDGIAAVRQELLGPEESTDER
jgi:hypothetical protein